MTAAYFNLRGRYRSLGRSFRILHITHRSAAYFCRIHSANYFPHSAFPQITNTHYHHFSFTQNQTIPALNVTDMAPVRLLFLRKIALLTLMLTSSHLSSDADLERNLSLILCLTFILTLIALDALRRTRHILPTPRTRIF